MLVTSGLLMMLPRLPLTLSDSVKDPKEGELTIRGFLHSLRNCFLQGRPPIDHVELFELITAK